MDTAALAAQSDPRRNRQFSRPWTGPPPLKRRSPALAGTSNRATDFVISSNPILPEADRSVQRAIACAAKRVGRLRHQARVLAGIGQHEASLRHAELADSILREALA